MPRPMPCRCQPLPRSRTRASPSACLPYLPHSSMRMPRRAEALDDVVVARRELEAGAGRLLSHGRAVELLPGRVVLGIWIAALGLQPLAAFGEVRVGDQDVRPALAEIDAD